MLRAGKLRKGWMPSIQSATRSGWHMKSILIRKGVYILAANCPLKADRIEPMNSSAFQVE